MMNFHSRLGRWVFMVTIVLGLAGLGMASANGPSSDSAQPAVRQPARAANPTAPVPVPEPPAVALFVVGTVAIAWTHRRRSRVAVG